MPVKLFVGTNQSNEKPQPFQFFHEQYPGAIRILRRLWAKLHPLDETTAILVEANVNLPRNGWFKPDMVIMTPRGIGILEQKHSGGEITVEGNFEEEDKLTWHFTKPNGQRVRVNSGSKPNPAEQVIAYQNSLHRTLTQQATRQDWLINPETPYRDFYRHVKIQSGVCFTNSLANTTKLEAVYEGLQRGNKFSILDIDRVLCWVQSLRLGTRSKDYAPTEPPYEMSLLTNILPMIKDLLGGVEWEEAYDWMPQLKPYATLIEFAPGEIQRYYQLALDEVKVGRGNISSNTSEKVDITIDESLSSRGISRKHFEIERLGSFMLLHNRSPRMPIWISGEEVLPGKFGFLNDGDSITILDSRIKSGLETYYIFNRPAREPANTIYPSSIIR